ncbi:MAG TPA: hypothetical protein VKA79_15375 [Aestuariivirgaceae bacterium]|nr:hypothetical protein [Aestuariivirgaceae bacterium]
MQKAKKPGVLGARGRRLRTVTLSLMVLGLIGADGVTAAPQPEASPEITGSLPLPEAPYDLRAFITRAGTEGFELAARLQERGGIVTKPVSWRVFRILTEPGGGDLVYEGTTPVADFVALPGDYRIDVEYGFARYSRMITLDPERRQSIAFNLNVGGLRVLSRLAADVPVSFSTSHRIFALTGTSRAHLVAEDAVPGDLLRLPAGRYRIESHLEPGNAVARAEVEVKPGMLSAVEIDHKAGIASFAVANDAQARAWHILSPSGQIAATVDGAAPAVVLAPGTYWVQAAAGAHTMTRSFTVSAGRHVQVTLSR